MSTSITHNMPYIKYILRQNMGVINPEYPFKVQSSARYRGIVLELLKVRFGFGDVIFVIAFVICSVTRL